MRPATLAILAALALAGCGSDDDENTPDQTKPAAATSAKSDYVKQADAICKAANEKEAALGAEGVGWIYEKQFDDVDFLTDFVAVGREALGDLTTLTPPPESKEQAAAVVDAIQRMVKALDSRIAALRAGKKSSAAHIKAYDAGYKDLAVAAGPLGLSECQGILL